MSSTRNNRYQKFWMQRIKVVYHMERWTEIWFLFERFGKDLQIQKWQLYQSQNMDICWISSWRRNHSFFWGLYENETMFSVLIIAEVIDSSFEKPFCIELQNFFEKLFEILFCRRLTVGSDVCDARVLFGFIKISPKSKQQIMNLINSPN